MFLVNMENPYYLESILKFITFGYFVYFKLSIVSFSYAILNWSICSLVLTESSVSMLYSFSRCPNMEQRYKYIIFFRTIKSEVYCIQVYWMSWEKWRWRRNSFSSVKSIYFPFLKITHETSSFHIEPRERYKKYFSVK